MYRNDWVIAIGKVFETEQGPMTSIYNIYMSHSQKVVAVLWLWV